LNIRLLALALGCMLALSGTSPTGACDAGKATAPTSGKIVKPLPRSSEFGGDVVTDGMVAFAPALPYETIIQDAAERYDIDPDLIAAVIMTESRFNPGALSRRGAKGLMQIMPVTAESLQVNDAYDPEENIHAGTRYLRWLLTRLDDDVALALAAYNAGLRKVQTYQGIPPYRETEAYVDKVMQRYRAIKYGSVHLARLADDGGWRTVLQIR
jgi:hypothetical protein